MHTLVQLAREYLSIHDADVVRYSRKVGRLNVTDTIFSTADKLSANTTDSISTDKLSAKLMPQIL